MKKNRILFTALLAALFFGMLNLSNEAYCHCVNNKHYKNVKYYHTSRLPFYAQAQIRINTPIGSFYSRPWGYYPPMHHIMPPPPSPAFYRTNVMNIYL